MALAAFSIGYYGLNLGIDFTGGTLYEVEFSVERPGKALMSDELGFYGFSDATIIPTDDRGIIIKTHSLTEDERGRLAGTIRNLGEYTEVRYTSIGPVIGEELRRKGTYAILGVVTLIIVYIAFVFRKVSRPVSSWKYGVAAVIALAHDVLIPTGIFAAAGFEIDSLYLTALLAILGLSVSDTIVVFDRIRENLRERSSRDFAELVGTSISQTYNRSFNTSFTTILVLSALLVFGSEATRLFALALVLGMVAGTYSSIFFASPLLVMWHILWPQSRSLT